MPSAHESAHEPAEIRPHASRSPAPAAVFAHSGYFVLSLDTELAWGHFDQDARRAALFSSDGSRERWSIRRLLELCDEFGIVGTWALVGHLFYDHCEDCAVCPVDAWRGRYRSYEQARGGAHPLWYGADAIAPLLVRRRRHEIGFHGYTHEPFDRMSRADAQQEIDEWLRVARRHQIGPGPVVFPRNAVGHLDLFRDAGFPCYRPPDAAGGTGQSPASLWGKAGKTLAVLAGLDRPPLHGPRDLVDDGLVAVPASAYLYGFNRRVELLLDRVGLPRLRLRSLLRAVDRAARERKLLHVWLHPYELVSETELDKLRCLFERVAAQVASGRLRSVGMAELAALAGVSDAAAGPERSPRR